MDVVDHFLPVFFFLANWLLSIGSFARVARVDHGMIAIEAVGHNEAFLYDEDCFFSPSNV